jgi:ferredoxin
MEKVKVVKDACIGCGSCSAIAPEVFEMSDEGFAFVKSDIDFANLSKELEDKVMDAMSSCPTSAIEFDKEEKIS